MTPEGIELSRVISRYTDEILKRPEIAEFDINDVEGIFIGDALTSFAEFKIRRNLNRRREEKMEIEKEIMANINMNRALAYCFLLD